MSKRRETKKGKRTPLSRERVLRAATALADEGGMEALSMRNVAQALSVEAMSLYNHVDSKDDLLDGITDLVVSQIQAPTIGADWKAAMRQRAISAHEVLLDHPWASLLMASRVNVGPAMLRYVDATIGCLREGGFSFEMADRAWNALDSHVYGFTLQELNFPFDPSEYASAATHFLPLIPAEEYPHLHGLTLTVINGTHHGVYDFEFGLDLILDGLERALKAI